MHAIHHNSVVFYSVYINFVDFAVSLKSSGLRKQYIQLDDQ